MTWNGLYMCTWTRICSNALIRGVLIDAAAGTLNIWTLPPFIPSSLIHFPPHSPLFVRRSVRRKHDLQVEQAGRTPRLVIQRPPAAAHPPAYERATHAACVQFVGI